MESERQNCPKPKIFSEPPVIRTFTSVSSSPCLQVARQEQKSNVVDCKGTTWKGNCGCTCLCPAGPSN